MEFDDKQLKLGHLLLVDRKCRVCGEEKNLIDGFYTTRKNRGAVASSYSRSPSTPILPATHNA